MDSRSLRPLALIGFALLLPGCEKQKPSPQSSVQEPTAGIIPGLTAKPTENIDAAEKAEAAKLKPSKCPVQEEIYAFSLIARKAYNSSRFDELEAIAKPLRENKEVFANGSWKIAQFYGAFACREDESESMWKLHDSIHRAWVIAKPASVTAKVALADFLVEYAWQARGDGFADTVTEEGWRLFGERLAAAKDVLREASALPEKDPMWGLVALVVARGQDWKEKEIDSLLEEVTAAEPKFWGYHTERAISLLPRWGGQKGDWENYAEKVAARPDGLGDELYARIVLRMEDYHENVFRKSKASWPKTRDGLSAMQKKYPNSLELLSHCALLGALAEDRAFAKEQFDQLAGRYLPSVWGKPTRFTHVKHWAETGAW